jgi:hypothetical protein
VPVALSPSPPNFTNSPYSVGEAPSSLRRNILGSLQSIWRQILIR